MAIPHTAAHSPLTPKQQRFLREYAKSLNATQAALDAGYCGGRREKAGQTAWRLMKNPQIRAAIGELRARHKLDDSLSAQRVLEELRRLAFADIRSLYAEDGSLRPIHEWKAEQSSAVQEVTVATGVGGTRVIKARYWDKTKALEMLAKHYALTTEKTEVTGTITISWLPAASDAPPQAAVDGEVVSPPALAAPPTGPPDAP